MSSALVACAAGRHLRPFLAASCERCGALSSHTGMGSMAEAGLTVGLSSWIDTFWHSSTRSVACMLAASSGTLQACLQPDDVGGLSRIEVEGCRNPLHHWNRRCKVFKVKVHRHCTQMSIGCYQLSIEIIWQRGTVQHAAGSCRAVQDIRRQDGGLHVRSLSLAPAGCGQAPGRSSPQ